MKVYVRVYVKVHVRVHVKVVVKVVILLKKIVRLNFYCSLITVIKSSYYLLVSVG